MIGRPARQRIATVIAVWPNASLGVEADQPPSVKPWVMSRDKYNRLKRLNESHPLALHDVIVTCTDGDYQKFSLDASAGSRLLAHSSSPDWQTMYETVITAAQKEVEGIRLHLGITLPPEQLRAYLASRIRGAH